MSDQINPIVADMVVAKLEGGLSLTNRDREDAVQIIQWAKDAHLRMSEALHEAWTNGDDQTAISIIEYFMGGRE